MSSIAQENEAYSEQKYDPDSKKYVIMQVSNQLFGIAVESVGDILSPRKITPVPLATKEVMGLLNLRGRIVTAINLRKKLEISNEDQNLNGEYRSVVAEYNGNLYSLVVDKVSEVMNISDKNIAHNPENLSSIWKSVSRGVFSMKKELIVILDVEKLLRSSNSENIDTAEEGENE
jgi:purine-binding chemotaxis protein CheW